uniref:Uncharacterized protein n=1 Tax=Panagrolaimus sp. ES5 TaxID=591445 RepID=A0AC34FJV0_9BILA
MYREKFTGDRMEVYIANLTHNRYYRDKWVTPLLDTIQYYIFDINYRNHLKTMIHHDYGVKMNKVKNQQITKLIDNMQFYMHCCGAQGPQDWQHSQWRASAPIDLLDMDTGSHQQVHHVKNGNNYVVNYTLALPNVPFSCCTQMSGSSVHNLIAKSLVRCQQSGSTNKNWRHHSGCHERLQEWFNEQSWIFAGVGIGFAIFQVIGIFLSFILVKQIDDYEYLH